MGDFLGNACAKTSVSAFQAELDFNYEYQTEPNAKRQEDLIRAHDRALLERAASLVETHTLSKDVSKGIVTPKIGSATRSALALEIRNLIEKKIK